MSSSGDSQALARQLLDTLENLLPDTRPIALHEPQLDQREQACLSDCLSSGWISSAGPTIDAFEQAISDYTGIPGVVATVNGTAALHACLALAGVQADDEVIAPALTFVGTINPIRYQGAIPHLVDCDLSTLGVDVVALEQHLQQVAERRNGVCFNRQTQRRISALIVVHILGVPADMPALAALAERWHLTLIEDAAEALGSWREKHHVGNWGTLAALSFNGNKIISTGGGGAILCRDPQLAKRARHLCTTAKSPHPWHLHHDQVAYNYRLPAINAALGLAQMQRLSSHLDAKLALHQAYQSVFADTSKVSLYAPPAEVRSNHWLNLLLLPNQSARDALLEAATQAKLMLRPFWDPMHQLPMYANAPRSTLPNTESLWQRGICLPSSPQLASALKMPAATDAAITAPLMDIGC